MVNRLDIFYLGKKGLVFKRLVSFIISLALIVIISGSTNADAKGNTTLQSFNKAKKILLKQIYQDHHTTFYCQCRFTKDKKILSSSKYTRKKKWERAHRLEWEHIVPALTNNLSVDLLFSNPMNPVTSS